MEKINKLEKRIALNMINGDRASSLMLAGKPGFGKTAMIKQFFFKIGLPILTIEVPHINEELLIEVPFVKKEQERFCVENAESYILTQLKQLSQIKREGQINDHLVKKIKEQYNVVLFLDEFYRAQSVRIQNILRGILNGFIGSNKLPNDVYVVYASNLGVEDGSQNDIPLNHQFRKIEIGFDFPNWIKYIGDNKIADVATMKKIKRLEDTIVSSDISPRRWEEIIKILGSNLSSREKSLMLKSNIKDEEEYRIICEEFGISSSAQFSWTEALKAQLKLKKKLKKERKYVPVLSGAPGTGKTSAIHRIAEELKMDSIVLNTETIEFDSVQGFIIPDMEKNTVELTKAPLYEFIMKQYKGKNTVLFLDELTRADARVFNALRALLLENRVGIQTLPDNIYVVGAMNPQDLGAEELPDHVVDVLDIIEVEPNWFDLLNYINNITSKGNLPFDGNILINLLEVIKDRMASEKNDFEWTDGNGNSFYISPRELSSMIKEFVTTIPYIVEEADDIDGKVDIVIDEIIETFDNFLSFIMEDKQGLDKSSFMIVMKNITHMIEDFRDSIHDDMNTKKSEIKYRVKPIFEKIDYAVEEYCCDDEFVAAMQQALFDEDRNDFIYDMGNVVDKLVDLNQPANSMNKVISLWKSLVEIDWDKINDEVDNEIASLLSDVFHERGIKKILEYVIKNKIEDFKDNINDYNSIKIMASRKKKHGNIFID